MKIIVDGVGISMGGGVTVISNLLMHWKNNKNITFIVYVFPEIKDVLEKIIHKSDNIDIKAPYCNVKNIFFRLLWQQIRLPCLCKKNKANLLLSLVNTGSLFPTVPQFIFFHQANLLFEEKKNKRSLKLRLRMGLYRLITFLSFKKSAGIIFQTDTIKTVAIKQLRLKQEDCVTVFSGIPFYGNPGEDISAQKSIYKIDSILCPKLLYLSHAAKHKNFELLINGIKLLKNDNVNVKLILTLDNKHNSEAYSLCVKNYLSLIEENNVKDYIEILPQIPSIFCSKILEKIDFFVFPSFIESFPQDIPLALSLGKPMVMADRPYSKAICGDAALYFDPNSPIDFSRIIKNLLESKMLRNEYSNRAFRQSKKYSYKKTSDKIITFIETKMKRL